MMLRLFRGPTTGVPLQTGAKNRRQVRQKRRGVRLARARRARANAIHDRCAWGISKHHLGYPPTALERVYHYRLGNHSSGGPAQVCSPDRPGKRGRGRAFTAMRGLKTDAPGRNDAAEDADMNVRLLLADDHEMMRQGLRALIAREADFAVVAEAENGQETLESARKCAPHVVVMDVAMPDLNGIEATRKLLAANSGIKVVALSGHANREFVREMLKAGASAYVLKSRAYKDLVLAIHEVMEGKTYLSPDVARGVVDEYVGSASSSSKHPAFVVLTNREREALQLISEGRSTKEVADSLNVSVKTIETHRRNIMEKLNLYSVAEITKYAIREGITSVDA